MSKFVKIKTLWRKYRPDATSLHHQYIDDDCIELMAGEVTINLDSVQSYRVHEESVYKMVSEEVEVIRSFFANRKKTVKRLKPVRSVTVFNLTMQDGTEYETLTNIDEAMAKAGLVEAVQ